MTADGLLICFLALIRHLTISHANNQHFTLVGDSTSIYCDAPKSWKDVVVLWELHDSKIIESHFFNKDRLSSVHVHGKYRSRMDEERNRAELRISNISFEDAGNYTCVIYATPPIYTNQVLQVQSFPELSIQKTDRTLSVLDTECCIKVALPLKQTKINWTTKDDGSLTIANEKFTETRVLDAGSKLCGSIDVKAEHVKHEATLTCTTTNQQLILSSSLNLYDLYLSSVQMITPSETEVIEGEVAVLECQTGVSNKTYVYIQLLNDTTWTTLHVKPKRNPHRGSLFIYQFDIPTTEGGRFKCILSRNGEKLAESETTEITVAPSIRGDILTIVVASSCGFVFSVICIFTSRGVGQCLSKRCFKKPPTNYHLAMQTQMETGRSGDNGHRNSVDSYGDIDTKALEDNRADIKVTGEDLTLTNIIHYGKRRVRWNGLLYKGTNREKVIHAITSRVLTTSKQGDQAWLTFSSSILTLSPHPNLVQTLDVCEQEGLTYCIQENLQFGSLRNHLKAHRDKTQAIPFQNLASYATNVIAGLNFLHSHDWLHPGLCARKVLLTSSGKSCKLYDFCLKENAKEVVSILLKKRSKWTINFATESMYRQKYTERSDVWAIGVVIWEIFSFGAKLPVCSRRQSKRPTRAVVKQMLPRPDGCPTNIYEVMTQCWQIDSTVRPSLTDIEHTLGESWGAYAVALLNPRPVATSDSYDYVQQQRKMLRQESTSYQREIFDTSGGSTGGPEEDYTY